MASKDSESMQSNMEFLRGLTISPTHEPQDTQPSLPLSNHPSQTQMAYPSTSLSFATPGFVDPGPSLMDAPSPRSLGLSTLFKDLNIRQNCAVCNCPTTATCTECHGTHYCTPEHQQLDLGIHRFICPALKGMLPKPTLAETQSNTNTHYAAALVFPEYDEYPYYEWIPIQQLPNGRSSFDQFRYYGDRKVAFPSFLTDHPITRGALQNEIVYFQRHITPPSSPLIRAQRTDFQKNPLCTMPGIDEDGEPAVYQYIFPENLHNVSTNISINKFSNGTNPAHIKGNWIFLCVERPRAPRRENYISFNPNLIQTIQEIFTNPLSIASQRQYIKYVQYGSNKMGITCYPRRDPKTRKVHVEVKKIEIPHVHEIWELHPETNLVWRDARLREPTLCRHFGIDIKVFFVGNWTGETGNWIVEQLFLKAETDIPLSSAISNANNEGVNGVSTASKATGMALREPLQGFEQDNVGGVILAYADGREMEIEQLMAFVEYQTVVGDAWEKWTAILRRGNPGSQKGDKAAGKAFWDTLDKGGFARYWDRKMKEGEIESGIRSPYEGQQKPAGGMMYSARQEDEGYWRALHENAKGAAKVYL